MAPLLSAVVTSVSTQGTQWTAAPRACHACGASSSTEVFRGKGVEGAADDGEVDQCGYTPQVRGGKLRALGVGSAKRSPAMPDVPSVQEAGLAGYEVVNWWGFLAPAGTPVAIVRRINADINAVIDSAETRKRLEAEAAEPAPGAPDAFRKVIVDDLAKWSRVAKEADIRPH